MADDAQLSRHVGPSSFSSSSASRALSPSLARTSSRVCCGASCGASRDRGCVVTTSCANSCAGGGHVSANGDDARDVAKTSRDFEIDESVREICKRSDYCSISHSIS